MKERAGVESEGVVSGDEEDASGQRGARRQASAPPDLSARVTFSCSRSRSPFGPPPHRSALQSLQ